MHVNDHRPFFSLRPLFRKTKARELECELPLGVAFQVSLPHATEQGEWKFLESRSFSTVASIITF